MPKALQLQIPKPCHENWQQMTPNEQGRYCMACRKTVVDFSLMSNREILNYISKANSAAGGGICGRLSNDQLNKDISMQEKKRRKSVIYFWNLLLATFFAATKSYSQGDTIIVKKGEVVVHYPENQLLGKIALSEPTAVVIPSLIRGSIYNSFTNEPVPGASITFPNIKGTAANSKGAFALERTGKNTGEFLQITAVGYERKTIRLSQVTNWNDLKIFLTPKAEVLETVTVTGYPGIPLKDYHTGSNPEGEEVYQELTGYLGGISVMYKETKTEKVKKAITDLVPAFFKKEVKVYPNPVVRGSTINISLKLKETGNYKLELIDASGRVVWVQPLRITSKEQTATIPASSTWSSGIYWLRVTGQQSRQVYQSKVLLQ